MPENNELHATADSSSGESKILIASIAETHVDRTSVMTDAVGAAAVKNNLVYTGVASAVGLLILVFAVIGLRGARQVSEHPLVLAAARVFGINAAEVNGRDIDYTDYARDRRALQTFYAANTEAGSPVVSPDEQSDQVLSRLIANELIAQAAVQYKAEVTAEDLAEVKQKLIVRFDGSEAKLAKDIKKNFAMSVDTFFKFVVRPSILEQKLALAFASSTPTAEDQEFTREEVKASHILFQVKKPGEDKVTMARAQKVLDRIKKGEDFASLAKQYGSDGTKSLGGDLGWFGRGQMVPEFEAAVFALPEGELGPELVKTEFGYHIVKINARRTQRNFQAFMKNRLDTSKIKMYGRIHNPFGSATQPETASSTSTGNASSQ